MISIQASGTSDGPLNHQAMEGVGRKRGGGGGRIIDFKRFV